MSVAYSLCEEGGVHGGPRLGLGRLKWWGPETLKVVELMGTLGVPGHPRGAGTSTTVCLDKRCFLGF